MRCTADPDLNVQCLSRLADAWYGGVCPMTWIACYVRSLVYLGPILADEMVLSSPRIKLDQNIRPTPRGARQEAVGGYLSL